MCVEQQQFINWSFPGQGKLWVKPNVQQDSISQAVHPSSQGLADIENK